MLGLANPFQRTTLHIHFVALFVDLRDLDHERQDLFTKVSWISMIKQLHEPKRTWMILQFNLLVLSTKYYIFPAS